MEVDKKSPSQIFPYSIFCRIFEGFYEFSIDFLSNTI
jgi:hypothetical protein